MFKFVSMLFLSLLAVAQTASAAEAKTLIVKEAVTINAPADKFWAKVSNFGDLGAWHPAVAKTEIVEGNNNQVGAVRVLTLQDGGTIKEKLVKLNAKKMQFQYEILEGVLPVSHYNSTLVVHALGKDKAEVVWSSHFQRKDAPVVPAKDADDETAVMIIHGVYRGGLENIQTVL